LFLDYESKEGNRLALQRLEEPIISLRFEDPILSVVSFDSSLMVLTQDNDSSDTGNSWADVRKLTGRLSFKIPSVSTQKFKTVNVVSLHLSVAETTPSITAISNSPAPPAAIAFSTAFSNAFG
jgi:hypothetical protein